MPIIARKSMGAYLCKCTCGSQWVAEDEKGGEEGKNHKGH